MIKLGLVGEGIAKSQSPDLHERLGASLGVAVRYDLVDSLGIVDFDFPSAIQTLRAEGYRGTNVTFPFKEKAYNESVPPIRYCSMSRGCEPKTPTTRVLLAPTATRLAASKRAMSY